MPETLENQNATAENGGSRSQQQVGMRRPDCYVGIKPCGCMVAWVYDDPKYPKDVAKSVADFIKNGYSVERANTEEVRHKLGRCKCKPHTGDVSDCGRKHERGSN